MEDKDEHELKQLSQVLCLQKSPKIYYGEFSQMKLVRSRLHNSTGAFCVGKLKALRNDFSTELT